MIRIRYLLDEDTPHAIRDQLLRLRPDMEILAVGDEGAPPFGTPDAELLRWVEKEGYILVSRNRRTMPKHLHHHLEADMSPASFFCAPGTPWARLSKTCC